MGQTHTMLVTGNNISSAYHTTIVIQEHYILCIVYCAVNQWKHLKTAALSLTSAAPFTKWINFDIPAWIGNHMPSNGRTDEV